MIYLMGASHAGIVISSWAHPEETRHHHFGEGPPEFINLRSRFSEDLMGFNAASIYIGHYSTWWGPDLAVLSEDKMVAITPGFRSMLESMRTDHAQNYLFVFMTGEEHYHLGLTKWDPAIDFEIPWRQDLHIQSGRQVLPWRVVEKQVAAALTKSFLNFVAIRRLLPDVHIYNVICPPPIERLNVDDPDRINYDPVSLKSAEEVVRLKYYIAYTQLLSRFTKELGIPAVWPPRQAVSDDGFLELEYVKDKIHGNMRYGEAVIDQIRACVAGVPQ
jgi:hypothetical protein